MNLFSWFLSFYHRMAPKLLHYLQLQLFLTVLSLPILIAWGLPISIMSCVGNLIFSPFLALFLLISCIIFFFELCCLPNSFFIWCLEWLIRVWSWLISYGTPAWLIGFAKPSLWLLWCFPLATFFIMHLKKIATPGVRVVCFLITLMVATLLFKYYPAQQNVIIKQIPCNGGFVTAIKTHNTLTVIDPGVIGRRIAASWVEYTLLKELTQEFGTTTIDHFIVAKPGILSFDYAAQVCSLAQVSSLYLVYWQGESEKRLLQNFGRLRYALEQKKGALVRISKKPLTLDLDKDTRLVIEPMESTLSYKETIFPALHITLDTQNDGDLEVFSV